MTARIPYQTYAVDASGDVVSGAAVEVRRQVDGTLATLYAAATGGTTLANPFNAGDGTPDPVGRVEFWVDPGLYTVQIGSGGSAQTDTVSLLWSERTQYPTRTALVAARAAGAAWPDGTIISDSVVSYVASTGATGISDLGGLLPYGKPTPNHFQENTTPGTTDMQSGMDAWLAYLSVGGQGGKVGEVLAQDYLHSGSIVYPDQAGITIRGPNRNTAATNQQPCVFTCTSTSGPHGRIRANSQSLSGVLLRASGARVSAAYGDSTPGLLLELEADSSADLEGIVLEDVTVIDQPGDGFQTSGGVFMPVFRRCAALRCKGRPINVDWGDVTSRVNKGRAIGGVVEHFRVFDCQGPAKFGNRASGISGAIGRWTFIDADIDLKNDNATLNPESVIFDLHGENVSILNYAFGGRVGDPASATLSALHVSGRHIEIVSPRFVGVPDMGIIEGSVTTGAHDISLSAPYITNDCTMNPAFRLRNTSIDVGAIYVRADTSTDGGTMDVASWFPATFANAFILDGGGITAGTGSFTKPGVLYPLEATKDGSPVGVRARRTGSGAATAALVAEGGIGRLDLNGNICGGTSILIADDDVAIIVTPKTAGVAIVYRGAHENTPNPDWMAYIYYDTGTSFNIEKGSVFAGWSAKVDVSTSNVTGTTGTDGNVTVAVQSGQLKVENRTGTNSDFQITFL